MRTPGLIAPTILSAPEPVCPHFPTSVLIELGNTSNEATTLSSVTFSMSQCGREFRLSLIRHHIFRRILDAHGQREAFRA